MNNGFTSIVSPFCYLEINKATKNNKLIILTLKLKCFFIFIRYIKCKDKKWGDGYSKGTVCKLYKTI